MFFMLTLKKNKYLHTAFIWSYHQVQVFFFIIMILFLLFSVDECVHFKDLTAILQMKTNICKQAVISLEAIFFFFLILGATLKGKNLLPHGANSFLKNSPR